MAVSSPIDLKNFSGARYNRSIVWDARLAYNMGGMVPVEEGPLVELADLAVAPAKNPKNDFLGTWRIEAHTTLTAAAVSDLMFHLLAPRRAGTSSMRFTFADGSIEDRGPIRPRRRDAFATDPSISKIEVFGSSNVLWLAPGHQFGKGQIAVHGSVPSGAYVATRTGKGLRLAFRLLANHGVGNDPRLEIPEVAAAIQRDIRKDEAHLSLEIGGSIEKLLGPGLETLRGLDGPDLNNVYSDPFRSKTY